MHNADTNAKTGEVYDALLNAQSYAYKKNLQKILKRELDGRRDNPELHDPQFTTMAARMQRYNRCRSTTQSSPPPTTGEGVDAASVGVYQDEVDELNPRQQDL